MDVFISYRRDGGFAFARLLYECLQKEGISTFLDLEELRSGAFNTKLYEAIDASENFVIVLPPNSLDRCVDENDWVRLEIEYAIKKKKNIVPILVNGFTFPKSLFNTSAIARTAPSPGSMVRFDLTSMVKPKARTKQLTIHKIH